jgi:glycyl-tRNA synthetase
MSTAKDKKDLGKMETIMSLAKRRGFIFPGSEIYGGLANAWDYGPLGVELKNNIKAEWWKRFVHQRTDMVGLDAALIMNPKVWEASGHLKEFSDPLIECKKCHERFRADQIDTEKCPNCGEKKSFTAAKQFNLMLKTFLGPAEEKANEVYFRPETAQAMFVNFKNIIDTTRKKIPFGIAQIGKAFRNEITPGNFIFRTREFEQMEIEYFIPEPKSDKDWEKYFDEWQKELEKWIAHLGIKNVHYLDVPAEERAHYSKKTIDIEYDFPFGRKELYGLAYRGNYDLNQHQTASKASLEYTDPETGEKYLPHVIEPSLGVDRTILAVLLEAYHEEEAPTAKRKGDLPAEASAEEGTDKRVVMKFPSWLAPIKVAVLPLSKKEELSKIARPLYEKLAKHFVTEYDETQSIGRRYRREDEIGTPFCVTVDFETINDQAVTVRHRDTMKQERITIAELERYLEKHLSV